MYGVFAVGKRQGLELGIAAGTVNALGSTIDNAGNSISKFTSSVKPFKSKNRDKIDLDAQIPNLKKGSDRDFLATA